MGIQVKVFYKNLLDIMHNPKTVTVMGSTVGECLDDLVKQYPDIEPLIFDKQHNLLKPIFVFVNSESLQKPALTKPLRENDVLLIALLIAAG